MRRLTTPPRTRTDIIDEALSWTGVTRGRGRFGAVTLNLGRRELGHLHGNKIADIPLPRTTRDRLINDGSALPHRYLPESGWVTIQLNAKDAPALVLGLLRANYQRAQARRNRAADPTVP
jgi:hypothetical protein